MSILESTASTRLRSHEMGRTTLLNGRPGPLDNIESKCENGSANYHTIPTLIALSEAQRWTANSGNSLLEKLQTL
jgi:hypothetical protein